MYPIIEKLQTHNRSNQKFKPIGMVVHATADKGATDEAESSYMDRTDRKASANAFIDWDSITVKIPPDEISWAAGPTANHRYLNTELCEPATHDPAKFVEVWNRAVWFFAYTFINNLHIIKVTQQNLPSHDECTKWWHETTHTDPVGYFKEYGKTVQNFRNDVQKEIDNQLGKVAAPPVQTRIRLIVVTDTLNCRKGPGINFPELKEYHKGDKLTALGIVSGWYKLDINGVPGYVINNPKYIKKI